MIKYGFQTYTWQMSYDKYAGKIGHICGIVNQSGLHALEAEICMLKGYFDDPEALKRILAENKIEFFTLCLACDWLDSCETPEEKALADKAVKFMLHFSNPMVVLCQMPQADRSNLAERQKNALACVNAAARRAYDSGVTCVFHPNSPAGSVFRTYDDYTLLLDGLDDRYVWFAPDSGHIIKGGMNVYDIFSDYRSVIKHAHFKDIDSAGECSVMGKGITDFGKITEILDRAGYNGHIMVEDESDDARNDPDMSAAKSAGYIQSALK